MYKWACIVLTENCNFHCSFCSEGQNKKNIKMDFTTFKKILHKLYDEQQTDTIVLFGGEPLLNFTVEMQQELLKFKDNFKIKIFTNGSLLDDNLCIYFNQFPDIEVNISCHNEASIKGCYNAAKILPISKYNLVLVVNHLDFIDKFSLIQPILDQYHSHFSLQTIIPGFDFDVQYTNIIYETLVPYKKQLQTYDLFQSYINDSHIVNGADCNSEIFFTVDGRISLSKVTGLSNKDTTFQLDTPLKKITQQKAQRIQSIKCYPWQCETCPIKNYKKVGCPKANPLINDYTLCRRSMLLYSIIKEKKEMLCDAIMKTDPISLNYEDYNHKIKSIMLNTTDQCNFRCRMCFCHWDAPKMTKEIADKGIELALSRKDPKAEKITINFFGGEPLLNYELVQYVIEKWKGQCGFSMTTNGSLLTEEILDYLKDNKVGLLLSIDGDKETQDYNRPLANGQGTFDLIEPKLDMILERYPVITFRSTIIPETVKYLHHNYQFAKQRGFKNYFCTPDCYSNWDEAACKELQYQTSLIALDIIKDIYSGEQPLLPKFFTDGLVDYLRLKDNLTVPSVSPFRCGMGIYGFGVGATGIISACQEHSTITDNPDDIFIIGDVDNGISEEKHLHLINKFYEEKTKWLNTQCKECPLREICINHVCPSRQGFMFNRFDKHSMGDCIWTQCSYGCASMAFNFFEKNYSPNFEMLLESLLNANNNLKLIKEMQYEI